MGLVFKYGVREGRHPESSRPDHSDGLEFWITNKIREIRDKADNIKHKIGVLTGHDEIKLTRHEPRPRRSAARVRRCRTSSRRTSRSTTFVDVDLKGGDSGDRRGPRRAHHHAARQGHDREGAPPHRPVRDEGQVARRLRQRGQREGERRDDERDAQRATGSTSCSTATASTIRKDVVLDFSRAFTVARADRVGHRARSRSRSSSTSRTTRASPATRRCSTRRSPRSSALEELVFPFASSLVLHKDKQPEAKTMKVVARSSPVLVPRDDRHGRPASPSSTGSRRAEKPEQYNVAATVEGTLKTRVPERRQDGHRRAGEERPAGARLRPRRRASTSPTRSRARARGRTCRSTGCSRWSAATRSSRSSRSPTSRRRS